MIIKAVLFQEINDVQLICDARNHLLNPEVKPLGVSVGVKVRLQYQVIFKLTSEER